MYYIYTYIYTSMLCTSVSFILEPSHLVSDGSLVVEADPLVVLHEVRHFHLVVPDVGGAVQQHLADLDNFVGLVVVPCIYIYIAVPNRS